MTRSHLRDQWAIPVRAIGPIWNFLYTVAAMEIKQASRDRVSSPSIEGGVEGPLRRRMVMVLRLKIWTRRESPEDAFENIVHSGDLQKAGVFFAPAGTFYDADLERQIDVIARERGYTFQVLRGGDAPELTRGVLFPLELLGARSIAPAIEALRDHELRSQRP
jgi:hypothetical protein